MDALKQAWNAEGSPFKGQPFDPSLINFSGSQFNPNAWFLSMLWDIDISFNLVLFLHDSHKVTPACSDLFFLKMSWVENEIIFAPNVLRNQTIDLIFMYFDNFLEFLNPSFNILLSFNINRKDFICFWNNKFQTIFRMI